MKPAAFEYERPRDVEEALVLLDRLGEEAAPLAGGQSLVPLMNLRLRRPAYLLDLNAIGGLGYVREERGALAVGALARQRDVERSPVARRLCPLLCAALRHVGSPQTRNRGTVVGSLAFADPAAELPAVAVACGAELVLASRAGLRRLAASDFFLGPYTTVCRPDELVLEVRLPAAEPGAGFAFEELARGFAARPIVAAAALSDGAGTRAVLTGVHATPVAVSSPDELPRDGDRFLAAAAAELAARVLRRARAGRRPP